LCSFAGEFFAMVQQSAASLFGSLSNYNNHLRHYQQLFM